jgi:predicted amidophosphoribosyltransferase
LGKVIDVEFRPSDRGRWCVRCDEPFPDGTAMCPRCGGELSSAARHRAETQAAARRRVQKLAAAGGTLAAVLGALVIWLILR